MDHERTKDAALRGDVTWFRAARDRGDSVLGPEHLQEFTTLHWASSGGHLELVDWLLTECGADPNARRANSFSPLHSAAMVGRTAVVERLLHAGADPNAQTDPQKYSPMHSAAYAGHLDVVRRLVAAGGRSDLQNYRNETPRETAQRQNQSSVVAFFQTVDSNPPLDLSPSVRQIEWGKIVLDSGAEFRDALLWPGGAREWNWKDTDLHHVPGIRPIDVRELIDNGCDVIVLSRGQELVLQTATETLQLLADRKIETHHLESRAAVQVYNELARAGRRVGALIHSTC